MKTLSVGIGCRRHTSAEEIEAAVRAALGSQAFEHIATVASIETKAQESGLLAFCARHALPLKLFTREQIAAVHLAEPSAASREHLGVDGVCEPCALLGASLHAKARCAAGIPRLVARKCVHAGVTVAIASTDPAPADSTTSTQKDLP